MFVFRLIACAVFFILVAPLGAAGTDASRVCLTKEQRRAVAAAGKVVPLAKAIRAARGHRGDVVRARLCHGPNGFVYLLTLLARDGRVTRASVDAGTGRLVGAH